MKYYIKMIQRLISIKYTNQRYKNYYNSFKNSYNLLNKIA
jgi:hypothetical protein